MPDSVHALAHRPLTVPAVAELVGLPTEPPVPEEVVEEMVRRRGWSWEHSLVCDSLVTGHGHVLCSESYIPFGHTDTRHFLVFGEIYPVDPEDEAMRNGRWLFDLMDDWQKQPGWTGTRPATVEDCEDVLARAAQAVTGHLGSAPERTITCEAAFVAGPAMTHRVWRTPTHALILGPSPDNGPYGYLTHLQLSYTPLACGPDLPPEQDENALQKWITTHVDW
ncbi:hypothetical protein [Streptomyces sp. NPDC006551]|uniref:hypothetical protein n=1 Tax=Streptomyces sp. NPDC006551 TaxID=3157178 RepID=UPI00339E97DF